MTKKSIALHVQVKDKGDLNKALDSLPMSIEATGEGLVIHPKPLFFLQIDKLEFLNRPDWHTIHYSEVVNNWLAQWTVPNNYQSGIGDVTEILRQWACEFVTTWTQAVGYARPKNYGDCFMDDFLFTVTVVEVVPNKQFWPRNNYPKTYTLREMDNLARVAAGMEPSVAPV